MLINTRNAFYILGYKQTQHVCGRLTGGVTIRNIEGWLRIHTKKEQFNPLVETQSRLGDKPLKF